jgi:hypothetical protein
MGGTVPESLREDLPALAVALFGRDSRGAVRLLARMGFLRPDADTDLLARALGPIIDRMFSAGLTGKPGAAAASTSAGPRPRERPGEPSLEELREFMYAQPFQLPDRVAFLGKSMVNLMGVCFQLDPEMDLIAEVNPMVRAAVGPAGILPQVLDALMGGPDGSPSASFTDRLGTLGGAVQGLANVAASAVAAGRNIAEAADKAAHGALVVKLSPTQESRLAHHHTRQVTRLVRAGIGGVVTLGAVHWALMDPETWPAYALTAVGLVMMLSQSVSRRRR